MQNPQPLQTYWIKVCILTRPPPHTGCFVCAPKFEKLCPRLFFSQSRPVELSLRTRLRSDLISKLQCQVSVFAKLAFPASPTLAGSADLWGARWGLLYLVHLPWLLLEVRIRWAGAVSFVWLLCRCVLFKWEVSHLVHTPRSFLAGSAFFENPNKEIMIHYWPPFQISKAVMSQRRTRESAYTAPTTFKPRDLQCRRPTSHDPCRWRRANDWGPRGAARKNTLDSWGLQSTKPPSKCVEWPEVS